MEWEKTDEVQELFITSERETANFGTKSGMRTIALNLAILINEVV